MPRTPTCSTVNVNDSAAPCGNELRVPHRPEGRSLPASSEPPLYSLGGRVMRRGRPLFAGRGN